MMNMQFMLLLLGLVAVACANPQFTPTHTGSSGFSSFNNHGSNNSSSDKDATGSFADDSSSRTGGSSLHTPNFGRPSITDSAHPSPSSSFGGSSSFSSSAGKPFVNNFGSVSSGAGAGGSGSTGSVDSSGLSDSASDVHFSRSTPSPISETDGLNPASVSFTPVSSSGSSGSSFDFGSGSASHPSVFHAPGAAGNTTKTDERNDATTEASSSGTTFKFEMLLLFGLVAVACAVPQFNPTHFGSSGFSSVNNPSSYNSSSEGDSTDSSTDDSSSSSGGSSLHTLNPAKPIITDDAQHFSSSSPAHHLRLSALPADDGRHWRRTLS